MSDQQTSLAFLGFDRFSARGVASDVGSENADTGVQPPNGYGLDPDLIGRVVEEQRDAVLVRGAAFEAWASLSGRLGFAMTDPSRRPVVGDFVVLRPAAASMEHDRRLIDAVLPRRTCLMRQAAGGVVFGQVMAANVDTVLIATSANRDLNPRRLERYVAAALTGGTQPVVVVTKADLCLDIAAALVAVTAALPTVPVLAVSVVARQGLTGPTGLDAWLQPGATVVVVGSSGVGKSTLVNWLLGEQRQTVQSIGEGLDKGRHTTTARSLHVLPSGCLLIDTPGIREIAPWDAAAGVAATFADIDALSADCRFRDCGHTNEPGCAVQAAIAAGDLDPRRWQAYQKLDREQAYQARRADKRLEIAEKERWKRRHKAARRRGKAKRGDG